MIECGKVQGGWILMRGPVRASIKSCLVRKSPLDDAVVKTTIYTNVGCCTWALSSSTQAQWDEEQMIATHRGKNKQPCLWNVWHRARPIKNLPLNSRSQWEAARPPRSGVWRAFSFYINRWCCSDSADTSHLEKATMLSSEVGTLFWVLLALTLKRIALKRFDVLLWGLMGIMQ